MAIGGINDYDALAQAYSARNETNAWNAGYERPAALRMLGDVAGLRVLDAGCGSGAHAAELLERGAHVTGIDSSAGMLAIAATRLGPEVLLQQADLNEPLPLAPGSFDVVLASLVMHYMQDWTTPLREFRRVLTPGGRLVLSTHHPFMDHEPDGGESYFATYPIEEDWPSGDTTARMRFFHRPLAAMTGALTEAGFAITEIDEPQPDPGVEHLDPHAWHLLTTAPRFLFFAARAV